MSRPFLLYGPAVPRALCGCCTLLCLALLIVVILIVSNVFVSTVGPADLIPALETTKSFKVIIVGAGTAGLYTAYTLEKLGWDYELLEATNVYGGRVRQVEAGGFVDVPVDVGAEWLHVDPTILQDLMLFDNETVTDETIVFAPQTYGFYVRGKSRARNFARYFAEEEFKFFNSTWYTYLDDYIVPYLDPNKIHLNSPVDLIDYSTDGGVTVTLQDGVTTYSGDKVVVAVPLPLLVEEEMVFNPPLPSPVTTALSSVEWQPGFKVFVEFSHRFYRDMSVPFSLWHQQFGTVDGEEIYFDAMFGKATDRHVMGILVVGGVAAPFLEGVYTNSPSDQEIIFGRLLKKLDDMFEGQASRYHVKHMVQNWSGERWIGGAYTAQSEWDRQPVVDGVAGKVFFAGEHMAPFDMSTVHGAALSGRQAVNAIITAES